MMMFISSKSVSEWLVGFHDWTYLDDARRMNNKLVTNFIYTG
jgi:hypothetical protein